MRAALRRRSLELGEVAVLVAAFFTAAATDMLQENGVLFEGTHGHSIG